MLALSALVLTSCSPKPEAPVDRLQHLASWMEGSFSSRAQSAADSSFADIRLEMAPIWDDRTDGPWLYVEQAEADALTRPYRQRIYHLSHLPDGSLMSAVFELQDPLRFAGAYRDPEAFETLTPDSLIARKGCAVHLAWTDESYRGSTKPGECPSTLRGASYATSDVTVSENGIRSWDRGFDESGRQVWGSEAGPYRFDRARE
jgi:hypothetical protein